MEGNPAQTLVPESRAGEFRPMEGNPAQTREIATQMMPPYEEGIGARVAQKASRELAKKYPDDWRKNLADRIRRGEDIRLGETIGEEAFRASIDIPHSHELALERAGRVQREGQYLVPETPVVRPSTTLTETLIQARQNVADNMEMMREMRGIQEEMDRL